MKLEACIKVTFKNCYIRYIFVELTPDLSEILY